MNMCDFNVPLYIWEFRLIAVPFVRISGWSQSVQKDNRTIHVMSVAACSSICVAHALSVLIFSMCCSIVSPLNTSV